MYRNCIVCGRFIPKGRIKQAELSGVEAKYCSEKCKIRATHIRQHNRRREKDYSIDMAKIVSKHERAKKGNKKDSVFYNKKFIKKVVGE